MRKALVLLIILLVIGAYFIKTYNNLDLKKPKDLGTFVKVYSAWIYNLGVNVRDVTGYVTKKEWLPKNNSSNQSSN